MGKPNSNSDSMHKKCSLILQLVLSSHDPSLRFSNSDHLFLWFDFRVDGGANYWEIQCQLGQHAPRKGTLGPQLALANHAPDLCFSYSGHVFLWL